MSNSIPTCFFPSTIMFLDDSRDFLLNFTLQLDAHIAYRLYDSPYDALRAVHATHQPNNFSNRCFSEYLDANGCPITNYTVNIDLAAIHWEIYNPQRFSEYAVVVVDYAMPGMNGLEFCKKMENSPIKKILLTGRADEKTAVLAFNEGIIDLYIQKQNPNITQLINDSIARMQYKYFQGMSGLIVKMLSINSPTCLQDPGFAEFFQQLCLENNIVEYYLTETSGSYLLLDADARPSCLIMKDAQDLKLYFDLARDNKAPEEILTKLNAGELVPAFWNPNNYFQQQNVDWEKQLYPAAKIKGQQNDFYYAYIKNPPDLKLETDKILSYNAYLDQIDNPRAL